MRKICLLTAILLFVLAGCGKEKNTNEGEKVLNMAIFWLDSTIEPTESWNGWTLTRCGIGENLVQFDENLNLKTVIAESYEKINENTTVFTIRENVRFHNGNPVDAAACKASIERALTISNRDDVKFPVESITADGRTLTITTAKPQPTLLQQLADPVFIIVDAAADSDTFKYKPIATGAFKVETFDAARGMTLLKHTGHWKGEIQVDRVEVKYIQSGTTRSMALQSGEIDLAPYISAKDLTLFEKNDNFIVQRGPNLRIFFLRINMRTPYMKNLEFRKALSYGIDKKNFAEKIVHGIPAKGPFNSRLPFGHTGDDYYTYDPEKAKEILDNAGIIDTDGDGIREYEGKNIVMKLVSGANHGQDAASMGAAIQAQYKEIGLGVTVQQVENWNTIARTGAFDLLWQRFTSAPAGDPYYFLASSYRSGGAGNHGAYSNSKLDRICETLEITFDKEKRYALGREGADILMQDMAGVFLYYQEGSVVTSKKVGGVYRFISEIYYIDDRVTLE